MKTPLTKERLQSHFQYDWWKYLLSVLLCFLGWNLLFAVTAPQVPEEKKLDLMAYAVGDQEAAGAWLEELREARYPDQELFSASFIIPDEQYGQMVLSTRIFAGEGDLYILPRANFQTLASEGLFVPLEEVEGLTDAFAARGISIDRGWRRLEETGERHLYGLPVSALSPLRDWFVSPDDLYLSVRVSNGNDANALALLRDLTEGMLPPIPAE